MIFFFFFFILDRILSESMRSHMVLSPLIKNGVKDEAMGSRSTKCVNLSLKENIINFLVVGLIYFLCV